MELCRLLDFKDLGDERGKLVVVEGAQDIPFEIKRVLILSSSISQAATNSRPLFKTALT